MNEAPQEQLMMTGFPFFPVLSWHQTSVSLSHMMLSVLFSSSALLTISELGYRWYDSRGHVDPGIVVDRDASQILAIKEWI